MALTGKQRRYLRSLAHHLNATVQVGNAGVSDAVVEKVKFELENHELIKVKVGDSPMNKSEVAAALEAKTGGEVCQVIGKTVVLYKARDEDPEIVLPRS